MERQKGHVTLLILGLASIHESLQSTSGCCLQPPHRCRQPSYFLWTDFESSSSFSGRHRQWVGAPGVRPGLLTLRTKLFPVTSVFWSVDQAVSFVVRC